MASVSAPAVRARGLTKKQVMSLLGIVPLGVYVVAHLYTNLQALAGPAAFDKALVASRSSPAFLFLEIFGLAIPILVHSYIGLATMLKSRPNNLRYGTLRNLKYTLQRLAGLGLLLFLGAHVIKARILPATEGTHETWQGMHEALSEIPTFTVYALGLLAVSFHLANGLWGSALTFGLTVGPKAQKRMEWLSALTFVGLVGMSAAALYGFRPFMN